MTTDHECHLVLVGAAVPDDRRLDAGGLVLHDRPAPSAQHREQRAPGLGKRQGGLGELSP